MPVLGIILWERLAELSVQEHASLAVNYWKQDLTQFVGRSTAIIQ